MLAFGAHFFLLGQESYAVSKLKDAAEQSGAPVGGGLCLPFATCSRCSVLPCGVTRVHAHTCRECRGTHVHVHTHEHTQRCTHVHTLTLMCTHMHRLPIWYSQPPPAECR